MAENQPAALLEAAERAAEKLRGHPTQLAALQRKIQELLGAGCEGGSTCVPDVMHTTVVGPVVPPKQARIAPQYIADRAARLRKARDYRRRVLHEVSLYCLYTGHGFVAVFLAEKMNLRERDAGTDDLITDGRECHYTVACKGKTDGGNELRSDFTFADGLMQHVVLSERSKARKSLQVRCNPVLLTTGAKRDPDLVAPLPFVAVPNRAGSPCSRSGAWAVGQ